MRRTYRLLSGIVTDQTVEQTFMLMLKTSGGLGQIVCILLQTATVCTFRESLCGIHVSTRNQHTDLRITVPVRDGEYFIKFNSFCIFLQWRICY